MLMGQNWLVLLLGLLCRELAKRLEYDVSTDVRKQSRTYTPWDPSLFYCLILGLLHLVSIYDFVVATGDVASS